MTRDWTICLFYGVQERGTTLSAQFDADSLPMGAYRLDVVVTSYWADGHVASTAVPTRAIVVNEKASIFGAGWTMAGLQVGLAFETGVALGSTIQGLATCTF